MSEKRIRRCFDADYRTDKNLKACSQRSKKALEIYQEQQYCAKLLKVLDKYPIKKKNICAALDITIQQYSNYKKGIGIYPPHKKYRLEEFVAGFIDYKLKNS